MDRIYQGRQPRRIQPITRQKGRVPLTGSFERYPPFAASELSLETSADTPAPTARDTRYPIRSSPIRSSPIRSSPISLAITITAVAIGPAAATHALTRSANLIEDPSLMMLSDAASRDRS